MDELPNPLTPADCDLRDFAFMPLDVQRLCDSDLAALESPEACWAALLLWCKSWHQVPCASLPDDDRVLAKLTGYQRAPDAWLAIREGALRGWIKCADGRLYHPVVAEKANESWRSKLLHAYTKLDERVRKKNKARVEKGLTPLMLPTIEQWDALGRPLENDLFPPETYIPSGGKQESSGGTSNGSSGTPPPSDPPSAGIPPENALKGQGQGQVNRKPIASTGDSGKPAGVGEEAPLAAADISKTVIGWERERGKAVRGMSASQQQVIDLAVLNVTAAELRKAYDSAVADRDATTDRNPVNAGFLRTFVEKHRAPPKPPPAPRDNWDRTREGIERKGRELGILPGRLDWDGYREKIFEEIRRRNGGKAA